ncbi:MAG TPA: SDR family oxidoreductase [Dehalococcoidia bacterium]|nr:SDR family oxidoreductase [Dehalococcoidia bacterium]
MSSTGIPVNGVRSKGIVVITGASTGIGEACALRLDRAGYTVFAGVRRDEDAERLRAQASPRLRPVRLDVTDGATIEAARQEVSEAAEGLGIAGVVNNAGIGLGGPVEFVPLDDWRRQFEVNVFGTVAVTQAFMPMVRAGGGRVVLIGSIGGRFATPFIGPYCASKFAIEAIGDALRFELQPWGIHVAVVEPGDIATPIWDKAQDTATRMKRDLPPEALELYGDAIEALEDFIKEAPGKGIPPDRVAKAVQHALAAPKPRTRYIVGTDAYMQRAMELVLPDRILDRLIGWQLKIGKKRAATPERTGAGARD